MADAACAQTWGYEPSDPNDMHSKSRFTGNISGYAYFWILVSCVVVAAISLYMALGLIPTPWGAVSMCIQRRAEKRRQRAAAEKRRKLSAARSSSSLSP